MEIEYELGDVAVGALEAGEAFVIVSGNMGSGPVYVRLGPDASEDEPASAGAEAFSVADARLCVFDPSVLVRPLGEARVVVRHNPNWRS